MEKNVIKFPKKNKNIEEISMKKIIKGKEKIDIINKFLDLLGIGFLLLLVVVSLKFIL